MLEAEPRARRQPATDQEIGDYTAISSARAEQAGTRAAEAAARVAAEERMSQMEAETRHPRGERG